MSQISRRNLLKWASAFASFALLNRLKPITVFAADVRPHLYVDALQVSALRSAIQTTHASLWQTLKQTADKIVTLHLPTYTPNDPDEEQLWQRNNGDYLNCLTMAYRLSDNGVYLDAAKRWALASCAYPTWGSKSYDGKDLAAGHLLHGLAMVYDGLYSALDDSSRQIIEQKLIQQGQIMFAAAQDTHGTWWHNTYLQNHLTVNITGLIAAGIALGSDYPDAKKWADLAVEKTQLIVQALETDGASHEGVGYWNYGLTNLLRLMMLARSEKGLNFYNNEWLRQTTLYRLYMSLPRNAWTATNNIVNIADAVRYDWRSADNILYALAHEYGNEVAQGLANDMATSKLFTFDNPWLSLLWYDPSIRAKKPDDLPTTHHFTNMDIVAARSDWSGQESLVVFKCGPYLGHKAVSAPGMSNLNPESNSGHVHPDANHFVIFGAGEWQIRDDGYAYKFTAQHNTLLIDGKGQLGEGKEWFNGAVPQKVKALPSILKVETINGVDHFVGDATSAYDSRSGLKRFVRHLLYFKPDVLVVVDDIATNGPAHDLELRFFPESQNASAVADGSYRLTGSASLLLFTPLTAPASAIDFRTVQVVDRDNKATSRMAFVLTTKQPIWRNAIALSWAKDAATLKSVVLQAAGDSWQITVGKQTVRIGMT